MYNYQGRHKEVTIATCNQQPYKMPHQLSYWFTGQNSETKTCAWNVILTVPSSTFVRLFNPHCSHKLMDDTFNKTTAQWNFVMEVLSHI